MNRLQLLDLPPVWLGSMLVALEPASQLTCMFRACSNLQQLILSQSAIRSRLLVHSDHIQTLGGPLHAQALAMAKAAETNIHLELEATCAARAALSFLLASTAALINIDQQPQRPLASFSLSSVTAVTITDGAAPMSNFLPDLLVQHCPNLQELCLDSVDIYSRYCAPQLTCTSLQKLTLRSVMGIESAGFKHHLLDLPSLTELHLNQTGSLSHYEEDGVFWAVIARYSSQLKRLSTGAVHTQDNYDLLPWPADTQLSRLEELNMGAWLVNDEGVQHLVDTTPRVKSVQVHAITDLTRSFAQVPCSWQELRIKWMYVPELAMLPLSSCTRLECLELFSLDVDWHAATAQQITAALKAVQAAGGLHFAHTVQVKLFIDDLEHLAAAGPLLQRLSGTAIVDMDKDGSFAITWSDCRALLAVLGQHLKCNEFRFTEYQWLQSPSAAAQLPDLLPHVQVFSFRDQPPEAELVEMVRTATRPFTLRVHSDDNLGAQLQQAMQEADHQLVTVADADE